MVVFIPPPPSPSKRSLALSARLQSTIDDFRAHEPKLTDAEIRSAIEHARGRYAAARPAGAVAVVGTAAGLVVALGIGIAVSLANDGGLAARPQLLWPMLAALAAVLVVGGLVLLRMRE
jgi:hypothetical protein